MRVRFNNDDRNELFANDTFTHYFAESELIEKKIDDGEDGNTHSLQQELHLMAYHAQLSNWISLVWGNKRKELPRSKHHKRKIYE